MVQYGIAGFDTINFVDCRCIFDLVGGKSYTSLHIVLGVWVPWFFFLSNQSLDFAGQSLDTHFLTLNSKSKGSKNNSNFHKFFGRENTTSMTFDNHICLLGARIYCICKSCKRVWHKLQKDNTVHHTVHKTSLRFRAFLQIRLFLEMLTSAITDKSTTQFTFGHFFKK